MNKVLILNIINVILFWLTGPLYNMCYTNSPGAKLALAIMVPLFLIYHIFASTYSFAYSLYCCIKKRKLAILLPVIILIIGYGMYFVLNDGTVFWYRVIEYFL